MSGVKKYEGIRKQIGELYDYAISKLSNKKRAIEYGMVDHNEAARIKTATGLDVDGYKRVIDNYTLGHILKGHIDQETEESRGNIAITKDDIVLIPEIIETADRITLSEKKTKTGLEAIRYEKRINGAVYIFEEVRTGKKELVPVTVYKKRVATNDMPPSGPFGEASSNTSETFRNPSANIIQSPPEIVKPQEELVKPDIQLMSSLKNFADTGKISVSDAQEIQDIAKQNNWSDETVKQFTENAITGLRIQNKDTESIKQMLITAKIKEAAYKQNAEKYKEEIALNEKLIERLSDRFKIEGGAPTKVEDMFQSLF